MITELRRYRIDPERLDSWLTFFEEAVREHVRRGMRVEYAGLDRETSTLVWMRSFESEAERATQKDAFYGSDWWNDRESFAMGHVIEYEVTFLEALIVRDGGEVTPVPRHDPSDRAPGGTVRRPAGSHRRGSTWSGRTRPPREPASTSHRAPRARAPRAPPPPGGSRGASVGARAAHGPCPWPRA